MRERLTPDGRQAIPGFFFGLSLLLAGCTSAPAPVPLSASAPGKDAAVEAILQALWARDAGTLSAMAVTESEFLKYIWPALPAGRPEVGMPADRAWADQAQRNAGYLSQLLAEHGGRRYELVAVSFGRPATTYGTFTIHPETTLDVRENGVVRGVQLFGSMIESGRRWKIYSFVVD